VESVAGIVEAPHGFVEPPHGIVETALGFVKTALGFVKTALGFDESGGGFEESGQGLGRSGRWVVNYKFNILLDLRRFSDDPAQTGPWEFLATDTSSPYTDSRTLLVSGQAETREYRLRWFDDGPNGDWSPVQRVTVGS
jgi:hypothetical protein